MTETTYPLDVAAEMLGCQQKKIITEWAKNTISVVMDLGDNKGPIARISIDAKTQPDSKEFFNSFSLSEMRIGLFKPLTPEQEKINKLIDEEQNRLLLRHYGCSVFKIHNNFRDDTKINLKENRELIETKAVISGLWIVNYNDFIRQHVQNHFTLTPYPAGVVSGEIKAELESDYYHEQFRLTKKNLRITTSDMMIMRGILAGRHNKKTKTLPANEIAEQQKQHGGIERFALEREKILAAALYVAHHYPKEIGKSFKSHAEAIEKHSYIFWKNEPAPDAGRIAKMISDAARPPEEWKILGGNAKAKK